MFFDFFKSKKPALKIKAKQEVEIEFFSDETFKTYFTTVLDVRRKEIILKSPGTERRPVKMETGQAITVTVLDTEEGKLYYFNTTVTDAGEREFDIANATDVKSEDVPKFDSGSIEAPVNVDYRPMSSPHIQSARTISIGFNSIVLSCYIAVPTGMDLHIEMQIPGAPVYSFKGRAISSRPDPSSNKKHLCEIEYSDDASREDRLAVMRYAVYLKRREYRRIQREGDGDPRR